VCVIFAGVRGYLDRVAVNDVTRFEQTYRAELKAKAPEILETIRKEREISNATEEKLKGFLDQFMKTFA
jgi:F-type H+-transporting ATPase subunit alpha